MRPLQPTGAARTPDRSLCAYPPCRTRIDRTAPRSGHKKYCSDAHRWADWDRRRVEARAEQLAEQRRALERRGGAA